MDGVLRFKCTNPEQDYILSQPDVGVDDTDKVTTSKVEAGAREELRDCRLAGNNEKKLRLSKGSNSTQEGDGGDFAFRRKRIPLCFTLSVCLVIFFCCIFSVLSGKQVREARTLITQGCESDWDAPDA